MKNSSMQEIERKFLVKGTTYRKQAREHIKIRQAYLNYDPRKNVRIRLKSNQEKGVLTIKGKSSSDGLERFEWETPVDFKAANNLLRLCDQDAIVEKTRFLVPCGKHYWEVDEFSGANQGLVVAEIELDHKNENFQQPEWCGEEITGIACYYNLQLAQNPFGSW